MIIVTGGSGQLGRLVVENLLTRISADQIGMSVRDASNATDFVARGVRVRQADFEDEDSLIKAFQGGAKLLLVSSNAAAFGGDTLLQHRNAIAAAKAVGIDRIFYTAQVSAAPDAYFPPGLSHYATECMLAASGVGCTSLRHGFYASSGLRMIREGLSSGSLRTPADGPVAWTTHEDLAEADAALLTGVEVIDGPVTLTAEAQYDFGELAELATGILGHSVVRDIVDDASFEAGLVGKLPPMQVGFMMSYYRAARSGEFAKGGGALGQLLGRTPTSMQEVLQAKLGS